MMEKPTDTEVEREGAAKSVRAKHPLPRWVALIFFAVCLGLIPQIVGLSSSLNQVALANHWRAVWVGLDIAEAVVFLLTAWLLFRQSNLVSVTASMAATILWLDAWLDVLTSSGQANVDMATYLAVLVEVPLGFFCLYVALRSLGVRKLP